MLLLLSWWLKLVYYLNWWLWIFLFNHSSVTFSRDGPSTSKSAVWYIFSQCVLLHVQQVSEIRFADVFRFVLINYCIFVICFEYGGKTWFKIQSYFYSYGKLSAVEYWSIIFYLFVFLVFIFSFFLSSFLSSEIFICFVLYNYSSSFPTMISADSATTPSFLNIAHRSAVIPHSVISQFHFDFVLAIFQWSVDILYSIFRPH